MNPGTKSDKLLVSACLLGHAVRYDGGDKRCVDPILQRWLEESRVVPVCPELAGGLPVPRPAAEIEPAGAGEGTLALLGRARVLEKSGVDVSAAFVAGAQQALALARAQGVRVAVLKQGSPSCGSARVHDGSFSGRLRGGQGVTAALLRQAGLRVFDETELAAADAWLRRGGQAL